MNRNKCIRRIAGTAIVSMLSAVILFSVSIPIAYADEPSRWDDILSSANIRQIDIIDKEAVKCEKTGIELKSEIFSYDVSNDMIAVYFDEPDRDTLGIFDNEFNLMNSFELDMPTKSLGIAIYGDNIVLLPSNTHFATEITREGEIVCMYKIQEQTVGTINKIATRSLEKKGDDTYYVSLSKTIPDQNSSSLHSTYLIRQGPSGEKEILYDSSRYLKKRVIIWLSVFVSVGILCLIVAYFQYIKPGRREIEAIREEVRQRPVRTESDNPMDHFRRKKKDGSFEKL